jgi:hypothetical protein
MPSPRAPSLDLSCKPSPAPTYTSQNWPSSPSKSFYDTKHPFQQQNHLDTKHQSQQNHPNANSTPQQPPLDHLDPQHPHFPSSPPQDLPPNTKPRRRFPHILILILSILATFFLLSTFYLALSARLQRPVQEINVFVDGQRVGVSTVVVTTTATATVSVSASGGVSSSMSTGVRESSSVLVTGRLHTAPTTAPEFPGRRKREERRGFVTVVRGF